MGYDSILETNQNSGKYRRIGRTTGLQAGPYMYAPHTQPTAAVPPPE
jgi:hypothetical protein